MERISCEMIENLPHTELIIETKINYYFFKKNKKKNICFVKKNRTFAK